MTQSDQKEKMESFLDKCKENNLKITPQRVGIYEEVNRYKDHPSTDTVFKRVRAIFPNISFDTVSRTLLTFTEKGIIDLVEGHGSPKRFDSDVEHHHHFWCMKCHTIVDIYSSSLSQMEIPAEVHEKKLTVIRKKVVLEGICDQCAQNS